MNEPTPSEMSKLLDKWLKDMPMPERKQKTDHIAKTLKVSKRTIENWRGGRPVGDKHIPELQEIMRGKDKISIEFEPEVLAIYRRKAAERGMTVSAYLSELAKLFGCIALLGVVAWQAFTPDDHQLVRKFGRGRRRDDIAAVEEIDTDGGEG